MFQHFIVNNFRCFAGLHLRQLERVNLIAGKNNTGKTALLEAIQLHCRPTDCVLPIQINASRGIEEPSKDVEGVCRWLLWQGDLRAGVMLESQDTQGVTRTLSMHLLDAATFRERFPEEEKMLGVRGLFDPDAPRILLRYEQPGSQPVTSAGFARQGQFYSLSGRVPWKVPCTSIRSGLPSSDQDVEFFAELELAKRQEEILPALRILEPRLERLAVVPLAGKPVIHGDIGLPRLIPVPFMGEGVRRVLAIVLAIANAAGGVVLIDEIENGLHYSVMKNVWQAIAHAARQADVQVFATTHSYECVTAAHEAFTASGTYDFRLHRLEWINKEVKVASYTQEILAYATEMNHEVR